MFEGFFGKKKEEEVKLPSMEEMEKAAAEVEGPAEFAIDSEPKNRAEAIDDALANPVVTDEDFQAPKETEPVQEGAGWDSARLTSDDEREMSQEERRDEAA